MGGNNSKSKSTGGNLSKSASNTSNIAYSSPSFNATVNSVQQSGGTKTSHPSYVAYGSTGTLRNSATILTPSGSTTWKPPVAPRNSITTNVVPSAVPLHSIRNTNAASSATFINPSGIRSSFNTTKDGLSDDTKKVQRELPSILPFSFLDDSDDYYLKRRRPENEVLEVRREIIIEQRFHSHFIGRKGEEVKRLRQKYQGIRIHFPKRSEKTDAVELSGGVKENVDACYTDMENTLKQLIENSHEEKIFVWHYLRGEIVGKAGANIRKMQDETNVRICCRNYDKDFDSVCLIGKHQNIARAKQKLDKYELTSKERFITERIDMPFADQMLLLDPTNREIFHLKKFHNVNCRATDDDEETVSVIGESSNVYNFVTALVTYLGQSNAIGPKQDEAHNSLEEESLVVRSEKNKDVRSKNASGNSRGNFRKRSMSRNNDMHEAQNILNKIHVRNIPYDATEKDLFRVFSEFGPIAPNGVTIIRHKKDPPTKPLYGFVRFLRDNSVQEILDKNLTVKLKTNTLRIVPAKQQTFDNVSKKNERSENFVSNRDTKSQTDEIVDDDKFDGQESLSSTSCSIKITNVPKEGKESELIKLFEEYGPMNEPPVCIVLNRRKPSNLAYVNFTSPNSVENVLSKRSSFYLRGVCLQIHANQPLSPKKKCSETVSASMKEENKLADVALPYFMIKANNLPQNFSRSQVFKSFASNLFNFFLSVQNRNRDVLEFGKIIEPPGIKYERKLNEAFVPFDANNTNNPLCNFTGTIHLFNCAVQISPVSSSVDDISTGKLKPDKTESDNSRTDNHSPSSFVSELDQQDSIGSRSLTDEEYREWIRFVEKCKDLWNRGILVTNSNRLSSVSLIKQYFQNERRSGGGPIVDSIVQSKFNRAILIFSTDEPVGKILRNSEAHKLEDHQLYVTILPPIRSDGFFLRNIPKWILLDRLKDYLEAKTHLTVDIQFDQQGDGAVINLSEKCELDLLAKKFIETPLKEGADRVVADVQMLIVPMIYSNTILCYRRVSPNILKTTAEEKLKQAFSTETNFIAKITTNQKTSTTVIVLKDYKYAQFLTKDIFFQSNVSMFYDELGLMSQKRNADFVREYSNAEIRRTIKLAELNVLSSDRAKNYVQDKLDSNNYKCVWNTDVDHQCLTVVATKSELGAEIADLILSTLKSFSVEMDDAMAKVWDNDSAGTILLNSKTQLEQAFFIEANGRRLNLVTLENQTEKISKMVNDFFESKAKQKEIVSVTPVEAASYIKTFLSTEITRQFNNVLDVQFLPDGRIEIYGCKTDRLNFIAEVNKIKSGLNSRKIALTILGVSNYYRTVDGEADLMRIGNVSKTLIKLEKDVDGNKKHSKSYNVPVPVQQCDRSRFPFVRQNVGKTVDIWTKVLRKGPCSIKLVKGDIRKSVSDVIVNAVGDNVFQSGVLSNSIIETAGVTVVNELKRICYNDSVGQNYVITSAGILPCRRIVHIYCPIWSRLPPSGLEDLSQRICSCLGSVKSMNYSSISFPAIGSGGRKYPAHVVAKTMFGSVLKWCSLNETTKMTISFVIDISNSLVIAEFEQEMRKQYLRETEADLWCRFEKEEGEKFMKSIFETCCNSILDNNFCQKWNLSNEDLAQISVYGPSKNVAEAIQKLREINSKICEKISVPYNVELGPNFTSLIKLTLDAKASLCSVKLLFGIGNITVEGVNAKQFSEKLSEMFDRTQDALSVPANLTSRWYYRNQTLENWKPTIQLDNARLEKAFKQNLNGKSDTTLCQWPSAAIDFNSMTLSSTTVLSTNLKSYQKISLKRKEVKDITPIEWNLNEYDNEDFKLVTLDSVSEEYINIIDTIACKANVIEIQRVENPMKFKQFSIQREKVKASLPVGFDEEKVLFYFVGENEADNISQICRNGFDRSVVEQTGYNLYGRGCHFFRHFTYSNPKGESKAFYVRVLTGEFTVGTPNIKTAPTKAESTKQYDSVVDDLYDPKIFVVFSDNHAYPAYLLTYKL